MTHKRGPQPLDFGCTAPDGVPHRCLGKQPNAARPRARLKQAGTSALHAGHSVDGRGGYHRDRGRYHGSGSVEKRVCSVQPRESKPRRVIQSKPEPICRRRKYPDGPSTRQPPAHGRSTSHPPPPQRVGHIYPNSRYELPACPSDVGSAPLILRDRSFSGDVGPTQIAGRPTYQ